MDLYREEILEHWQNPQNWGTLADFDLEAEVINPLCGDRIKIQIKLGKKPNGTYSSSERRESRSSSSGSSSRQVYPEESRRARTMIEDIRFTGNGCAISIASASILSQNIKNKPVKTLAKITGQDVLKMIGGPPAGGFPPARLKCAFLALEAIKKLQVTSNK